jgi:hypothetical protein
MHDPIEELRNPRRVKNDFLKYLKEEVFRLNFYRAHMLYFIVVIAIASVIVYGQGLADGPKERGGEHLTYTDALFLSCSAMTTTGLNSVDLGDLSGFQQATFAVLLMIGNIPFVSSAVVLIRRALFRKKMADVVKHSHTMQRLVRDIENSNSDQNESSSSSVESVRQRPNAKRSQAGKSTQKRNDDSPQVMMKPVSRRRTFHYETGFGFIPTPWEIKSARTFFSRILDRFSTELKPEKHDYISFKPHLDSKGRFRELSEQDRMEL